MVNEFESFDVNFKIVSNKNDEVYVEGYVTINDEEAEDVDWYYWNGSGYTSQRVLWHDGVQITGATMEQENELAQFESDLADGGIWIDEAILQSNDDENRTYVRKNITLIINDGAKIECEIKEPSEYRGDYVVELIPKYNGELIDIAGYLSENNMVFDPYSLEEDSSVIDGKHIYFEISKYYFSDDESEKEEELEIIIEEVQLIFQAMLFTTIDYEDDIFEQSLDSDLCEQDELFDLYCWANGKLTAQQFADRNGYEWES